MLNHVHRIGVTGFLSEKDGLRKEKKGGLSMVDLIEWNRL